MWKGFDCDLKKLCHYLSRNLFPERFIERLIKKYLNKKWAENNNNASEIQYIKLPYIGEFSDIAKRKVMKLFKRFCKTDSEICYLLVSVFARMNEEYIAHVGNRYAVHCLCIVCTLSVHCLYIVLG